jgi:hypothetical protein
MSSSLSLIKLILILLAILDFSKQIECDCTCDNNKCKGCDDKLNGKVCNSTLFCLVKNLFSLSNISIK